MGRRLKTRLDVMRPNLAARVRKSQARQKQSHDCTSQKRHFAVGDQVFVHAFQNTGPQWVTAVIVRPRGPVSFDGELADGRTVHCHVDHVRVRTVPSIPSDTDESPLPLPCPVPQTERPDPNNSTAGSSDESSERVLRRSSRVRRAPDCYSPNLN